MPEVRCGRVVVSVPDTVRIPDEVDHLSPADVKRLVKARRGLGEACHATAEVLRKVVDRVTVPGVTADKLDAAGAAAEEIDLVIGDLKVALFRLARANLLLDSEAHELLRRVLHQIRAQGHFDPSLEQMFPRMFEYFSNQPRTAAGRRAAASRAETLPRGGSQGAPPGNPILSGDRGPR